MDKRIQKFNEDRTRVDIELPDTRTTPSVYWSPRSADGYSGCNSYVVVESPTGQFQLGDTRVSLCSINGYGEVRWAIHKYEVEHAIEEEKKGQRTQSSGYIREGLLAMRHFDLKFAPQKELTEY